MAVMISFDLGRSEDVKRVMAMIRQNYPGLFSEDYPLKKDVSEDYPMAVLRSLGMGQFYNSTVARVLLDGLQQSKPDVEEAIVFLRKLASSSSTTEELVIKLLEIESRLERGSGLEKFASTLWVTSPRDIDTTVAEIKQPCQELLEALHIKDIVPGEKLTAFCNYLLKSGLQIQEFAAQLWQLAGEVESPHDLILHLEGKLPGFNLDDQEIIDLFLNLIGVRKRYEFGDFVQRIGEFLGLRGDLKANYPFKLIVKKTMGRLDLIEDRANFTEESAELIVNELQNQWKNLERPVSFETVKQFLLYSYNLTLQENGDFNRAFNWLVGNILRSLNTIT